MAYLYTRKQIQDMLERLRIKPQKGLVTTQEAARIMTARAKEEQGIEHDYPESAVRRHVELGNLKVAGKKNEIANLYKLEDIFEVPLAPKRGIGQRKKGEEHG